MLLDGYELETDSNGKIGIKGKATTSPSSPSGTTGATVELSTGLTPVVYSDSNWKVADTKQKWYDYNNQEWANAVILKNGVTKAVGDTIDVSSEVQGMFVWIPRYEYKIEGQYGTHTNGTAGTKELPGEIKVNFISKETTTASSGYHIHPAFTFGTEQLSGIWVGKFETSTERTSECYTSSNDTNCDNANQVPYIIPNVNSLKYQKVANQFTTAQKFNTYLNNSSLDAHMAKNSEWGAAAYLSQSKYGRYGNILYLGADKEIMVNNSPFYITGCGMDSSSSCNVYTTAKGQFASTTGNITGIYDMSGGSNEYVMGVYNKTSERSGFSTSTWPDIKYYDNYTTTDVTTACNGGICYGHALSETREWYEDKYYFFNPSYMWIKRGGNYNFQATAGIFYYYTDFGDANSFNSFRVVITHS